MLDLIAARTALMVLAASAFSTPALAQRPPAPSDPNKSFSFDKALDWLMARPGVMVAIALIIAVMLFMYVTQRKPKT